MSPPKLSLQNLRDSFWPFASLYQKVVDDPEKSSDSESEPDSASPLKREFITSDEELAYETRWNRRNVRVRRDIPWSLLIAFLLFLISLGADIVMRSRVDGVCMPILEPWSKTVHDSALT